MRTALTAGGLVVAVVAAATGLEAIREGHAVEPATVAAAMAPALQDQELTGPETLSRAFRHAAKNAMQSVVFVRVETERRVASVPLWPFGGNSQQQPQVVPSVGSGSGVIFRTDGYVLTNNHVVENASTVLVTLQDGREFSAEVVGRDPSTDIAVVKIDGTSLPAAQFGDADQMEVGDWVVALGYPLQLGSTATAGIVSAKGRSLGILAQNGEVDPTLTLEAFIQTDAAINPGNSGGPLVDLEGRVVGINTAIASRTGYYQGYGFAVPSNLAKRVADDLIEYGEYRRPRLGVGVQSLSQADVEVYKLDSNKGAEVTQVEPGGSAEKAGLQLGDVIVALDGRPIEDSNDLIEKLAVYEPGQTVRLDVIRNQKRMTFEPKLGVFEATTPRERVAAAPRERGMAKLGFEAAEVSDQLARRFELQSTGGVVVTNVDLRSDAARAGLQPGLVIEKVNGKDIGSLSDLQKVADDVPDGSAISVVVRSPDGAQRLINFRVRS